MVEQAGATRERNAGVQLPEHDPLLLVAQADAVLPRLPEHGGALRSALRRVKPGRELAGVRDGDLNRRTRGPDEHVRLGHDDATHLLRARIGVEAPDRDRRVAEPADREEVARLRVAFEPEVPEPPLATPPVDREVVDGTGRV